MYYVKLQKLCFSVNIAD